MENIMTIEIGTRIAKRSWGDGDHGSGNGNGKGYRMPLEYCGISRHQQQAYENPATGSFIFTIPCITKQVS